jgi:hypothetical protein
MITKMTKQLALKIDDFEPLKNSKKFQKKMIEAILCN